MSAGSVPREPGADERGASRVGAGAEAGVGTGARSPHEAAGTTAQTADTRDQTAGIGIDPRDDATLLADHVAGDPDAFAVLVARHRDRMWAVALRTTRHPDDAAEALQEAYIHAFRRAGSFRGRSKVTTWLHRIVVNACLDRLRRNKVRRTEPLPEDDDRMAELAADSVDHGEALEAKELQAAVGEALGRLGADQRAALVLVDMEGYSVNEAAEMLGCAPGTVKSRCARGRARLAPLVAHLREER